MRRFLTIWVRFPKWNLNFLVVVVFTMMWNRWFNSMLCDKAYPLSISIPFLRYKRIYLSYPRISILISAVICNSSANRLTIIYIHQRTKIRLTLSITSLHLSGHIFKLKLRNMGPSTLRIQIDGWIFRSIHLSCAGFISFHQWADNYHQLSGHNTLVIFNLRT
jgi:hypothetical protein